MPFMTFPCLYVRVRITLSWGDNLPARGFGSTCVQYPGNRIEFCRGLCRTVAGIYCSIGSWTSKIAPPSGLLLTEIVPRWRLMIDLHRGRPRPVPPAPEWVRVLS